MTTNKDVFVKGKHITDWACDWNVELRETQSNAGIETLVERKQWVIHPEGYAWTETTVTGLSPTVAEVALPANWNRQFERENVGIAFLITNG